MADFRFLSCLIISQCDNKEDTLGMSPSLVEDRQLLFLVLWIAKSPLQILVTPKAQLAMSQEDVSLLRQQLVQLEAGCEGGKPGKLEIFRWVTKVPKASTGFFKGCKGFQWLVRFELVGQKKMEARKGFK